MSFTQYEFADIWFHAGCARAVTSSSSIVCQPYSPEFMPMEGIWKTNRKFTTHNAFFVTPGPARRQADRDLQRVPAPARGDLSSCREVPVINNPCEIVLMDSALRLRLRVPSRKTCFHRATGNAIWGAIQRGDRFHIIGIDLKVEDCEIISDPRGRG